MVATATRCGTVGGSLTSTTSCQGGLVRKYLLKTRFGSIWAVKTESYRHFIRVLLRFSFSNVLSFKDQADFSLVAGRERQHANRVFHHPPTGVKLAPIAALFGENASGKSNFYRAVQTLRRLVLRTPQGPEELIPLDPFRLDGGHSSQVPCRFAIEILPSDTIYRLTIVAARDGYRGEKLEEVRGARSILIYSRERTNGGETIWRTEPLQRRAKTSEDREFIRFKTRDTLKNQLYLTALRGKKVPVVDEVVGWFTEQLALMLPDSTFKLLEFNLPTTVGLRDFCNEALRAAGTGVHEIRPESVDWADFPAPPEVKEEVKKKLSEGQITYVLWPDGRRFSVMRRKGQLEVARLFTHHKAVNGDMVRFELSNESEGTQRLIDLLPAFFEMVRPGRPKVFVIDELDRSLHTLLARHLIRSYLGAMHTSARSQLIFTTHDVNLLDQELLRRDEIWFVERSTTGVSNLVPLSQRETLRYDKDIRRSYLAGKLGGTPTFSRSLFRGAAEGVK